MSDHALVTIPRAELDRALHECRGNAAIGLAFAAVGGLVGATVFILSFFPTTAVIAGAVLGSSFGFVKMARALRAHQTIRRKLAAQELPAARVRR